MIKDLFNMQLSERERRRTESSLNYHLIPIIQKCKERVCALEPDRVMEELDLFWANVNKNSPEEWFSLKAYNICKNCDGSSPAVLNYARKVAGL